MTRVWCLGTTWWKDRTKSGPLHACWGTHAPSALCVCVYNLKNLRQFIDHLQSTVTNSADRLLFTLPILSMKMTGKIAKHWPWKEPCAYRPGTLEWKHAGSCCSSRWFSSQTPINRLSRQLQTSESANNPLAPPAAQPKSTGWPLWDCWSWPDSRLQCFSSTLVQAAQVWGL